MEGCLHVLIAVVVVAAAVSDFGATAGEHRIIPTAYDSENHASGFVCI